MLDDPDQMTVQQRQDEMASILATGSFAFAPAAISPQIHFSRSTQIRAKMALRCRATCPFMVQTG